MTRGGFVHQALCYDSDSAFLATATGFARDGLDAGDRVLAAVSRHNLTLLREALGVRSAEVESVDARDWYDYPSRTLGRYHAYCERQGPGRRVRIIGEPVWAGRSDFEIREWARYESVLNVAFAGSAHWILCPYDTRVLPADIVRTAARTHPEHADGTLTGAYTDPGAFYAECDARRSRSALAGPDDIPFRRGGSATVRRAVSAYARRAGMPEQRTRDLVAAVHETVVNVLRHGGGQGVVRLRGDAEYVICEVHDDGGHTPVPRPAFPGHLPPERHAPAGHGMWLVRQLADLVSEDLTPSGSVVQLCFRRPEA
ncbi:anti-sigma factor RsbA family regulatory protein [Streptomyces sp. NPDC090106]|uniref:anti-sigma factor RsbA family regulatory protein n=1 Tax=Streptomyces sp. NPDC090106 TaxID=3365946 RepID=UPI0038120F87